MFNKGISVKEISNELHLCQTTIRNYLHRGHEYNLCNYPPIYVGRKRNTPVICYDKNGNFTEYETIRQCAKHMGKRQDKDEIIHVLLYMAEGFAFANNEKIQKNHLSCLLRYAHCGNGNSNIRGGARIN